ncbi:MAG: hypothetical protein Q7J65_03990 [Candidatus Marinimicrobia bacterium]|nr:hypothetical protein [Candidatus Neomarinimicrobiota bacterium]
MSKEFEKYIDETPIFKPTLVKALNYVALLMALVLIFVIYVPSVIWSEEDAVRNEGRRRMLILNEVQKYYHQMANDYQTDPITAMNVVSAVRDSTRADSNYFGDQQLTLEDSRFKIKVPKKFYMFFDTTFAFSYKKKDTLIDTTYKVTKWNNELFTWDTLFVLASRWRALESDSSYGGVVSVEHSERIMENTYYLPYYLTEKYAKSPLIDEFYIITSDSDGYRIKDPLKGEYRERKYFFFTFKDTCQGWIENDQKSWDN